MTKITTLILFTICFSIAVAQTPAKRICGTMAHHEYLKQTRPNYEAERIQYEQQIQQYIANRTNTLSKQTTVTTVTVPVVVHVLYANATESISPMQAAQQVQVLNDDFAKMNADAGSVPAAFAGVAAGANIRFCLAQRDPSGNATTGIVYKSTSVTSWGTDDAVKSNSQGGDDPWDVTKYINIWLCNLGSGLLGYGEFPTTSISTTWGLVCHYASVPGGSMPSYNLGRTGTHEFGHVFNLQHTFGYSAGSCSGDDFCSDTPPQDVAIYGCFAVGSVQTDPCSGSAPGVQWMNYMNYTDDACMYMFTTQQAVRMEAVVNTSPWNILASSNGCTPVSTASTSSADASISSIISPANGSSSCSGNVTPTAVIKNSGTTTLTSARVIYQMDATATQTLNWTGSLAANATNTVTLNAYTGLALGAHTFSVWTNSPNGGVDALASNDDKVVTFTITNGAAPSVTSNSATACGGAFVTLTAISSAASFSWSNGATGASINVNPTTTTSYTVYASNGPGCVGTSVSNVNVSPSPTITVASATICAGGTATLNVTGATTYTWNTGASGPTFTANPTVTTPYTVGGSSINGCTVYKTAYVYIASSPVISVNAPTICAGANAIINASGVTSYTWSTGSNAASISVSPSVTTTYFVNGSLVGCASHAVKTFTVKVNPLPNVTFAPVAPLCLANAAITLGGSPINGTYTGTGVTGVQFNPTTSGIGNFPINYYYTDLNGCSNSASQTINVSSCNGIIELNNSSISIYPNPAKDVFYINFNNSKMDNTHIEVYDAIGKLVVYQKVVNTIETISMTDLSQGIYSIRIISNTTQTTTRIIKE